MSERKGIGEGGKTLKQMLEENEKLYEQTGCYNGITDPHLLADDPIKGELFHSRIMASLIAGRETTRMVSGSPFVREVAELCLGLLDDVMPGQELRACFAAQADHLLERQLMDPPGGRVSVIALRIYARREDHEKEQGETEKNE